MTNQNQTQGNKQWMTTYASDDPDVFEKETTEKEFGPMEEGVYTATVSNVTWLPDELKATVEWTIVDGKHKNRKVWCNSRLDRTDSRKFFKMMMSKLKHDRKTINDPEQIEQMLRSTLGRVAECFIQPNPWVNKSGRTVNDHNLYVNNYLNDVVSEEDIPDMTPSFDTDEDLPF